MTRVAVAEWQRLDREGTDRCELRQDTGGWRLSGRAEWADPEGPAAVDYDVRCDASWRSLGAEVSGLFAGRDIEVSIQSTPKGWNLNGAQTDCGLQCLDIDLSFTPATNLIPTRRCGDAKSFGSMAVWLVPGLNDLQPLSQTYAQKSPGELVYSSRNFSAMLTVHRTGFVTSYSNLWKGEVHV